MAWFYRNLFGQKQSVQNEISKFNLYSICRKKKRVPISLNFDKFCEPTFIGGGGRRIQLKTH